MPIHIIEMLERAEELCEESSSPEYNRGICELIARCFPNNEETTGELTQRIARIMNVEIR